MLFKLFGGLAVAAGLLGASFYGQSTTDAANGTCCSKGGECCKDCTDCSCESDCCTDCENGCECPNKP